jgi:sec-independent protein translocase protein TatA
MVATGAVILAVKVNSISGENEMDLGPTELILILLIVVLLFGVGRIGKIAGELGSGIRAFREGLQDTAPAKPSEEKPKEPETEGQKPVGA